MVTSPVGCPRFFVSQAVSSGLCSGTCVVPSRFVSSDLDTLTPVFELHIRLRERRQWDSDTCVVVFGWSPQLLDFSRGAAARPFVHGCETERLRPVRRRRTQIKYVIGLMSLAEAFRHSRLPSCLCHGRGPSDLAPILSLLLHKSLRRLAVLCSLWPFPTTWSAVNLCDKTFRPPNLVASELSEFESLQAVKPPDLLEPFEKLFKLIAEASRVMVDKGNSAPSARARSTVPLSEMATCELMSRRKKCVSRGAKCGRPAETDIPVAASSHSAPQSLERTMPSKHSRSVPALTEVTASGRDKAARRDKRTGPRPGSGVEMRRNEDALVWWRKSENPSSKPPPLLALPPELLLFISKGYYIEEFYRATQEQLASFGTLLLWVESSWASIEARVAEAEAKLEVEKTLRAEEAEKADRLLQDEKKALKAEQEAHEETKAVTARLVAEEQKNAIDDTIVDYRESDELKAEAVKLFK
ncbi:hypothetical protein Taro_049861 [Colocasia esculenta]|uniref:Uncharacterized protein n=1 Tax=Colocasia esculenta TaxID=4460 RepID=A0A843XCA7_COLES|nr:hypothetical protein [Colocasia esculenta]